MKFIANPDFDGPENGVFVSDIDAGLVGVIASQSIAAGSSVGECRMRVRAIGTRATLEVARACAWRRLLMRSPIRWRGNL